MIAIERSNTILYCRRWRETLAFYREVVGLATSFEKEWFVELRLHDGAYLSLADASRASVGATGGEGLTLTWKVPDLDGAHRALRAQGLEVEEPRAHPWGGRLFRFRDPEGHRIEIWSEESDPEGTR